MIILLPGMDGTGASFDSFISCLPVNIQTRVVSYPSDRPLSYRQLEELVVQKLPKTGDYLLIAESFSGPIALKLASRGNDGLKVVVLVSSFAYRPLGWLGVLIAKLPLSWIFRLPMLELPMRFVLLGRTASVGTVAAVARTVRSIDPDIMAGRLKEALAGTYCNCPIATKARVLAIHAQHDFLLGRLARKSISAVWPDAVTAIVDAPHLALQVKPLEVIDILRENQLLDSL